LTEDVDGVGLRVDGLADPVADFPGRVFFDSGDEDAALDAVAVGLQDRSDAGAAPLVADVGVAGGLGLRAGSWLAGS
jgi:hypothetical protein